MNKDEKIIKLNLGSGKNYREGYINIDLEPRFKPDVLEDIREIEYWPNTVTEIVAQDVIDHITFVEAKRLLRKCYKWLKPNGIINIHLPNLEVIGLLAANGNEEALEWLYGTKGEGPTHYDTNIIRWSYTPKSLRKILEAIGFKIITKDITCNGFGFRMIGAKT